MRLIILIVMALSAQVAFSDSSRTTKGEPQLLDCPNTPNGVIRFALRSDKDTADLFEWTGRTIHKAASKPLDKEFFSQFKPGSTHVWEYWEFGPTMIGRNLVSASSILTTPYSLSGDGKLLVAGLQRQSGKIDFEHDVEPQSIVLLDVATSKVLSIVDMHQSIDALSWSPDSPLIAILSNVERYGKTTPRERLSAFSGHPIPYDDITITVIGLDGILRCSLMAAQSLPYGKGLIRWDAN